MQSHPIFGLGAQLASVGAVHSLGRPKRRPRIVPSMRPGASSAQVMEYLQGAGGFRMACEIEDATGRSHANVSWALLFLRARGLVDCVPDLARNSRYLRYRAKDAGQAKHGSISQCA